MADFKIGDVLMYGSTGLVKIIDKRREDAFGTERDYYILREIGSFSESQIFVPTDNEKLVSNMRSLISASEARELLSREERTDIEWNKDNRIRSEKFRKIIDSGDREMQLSLISLINKVREARIKEGKKSFLLDENALEKAKRLITCEFSFVLGCEPEEIRKILSEI